MTENEIRRNAAEIIRNIRRQYRLRNVAGAQNGVILLRNLRNGNGVDMTSALWQTLRRIGERLGALTRGPALLPY